MRQRILALLAAGKTYSQIVAEVGCAKSTVAYHAKNVKEPPNYKVHDWAEVQKHYDEGHSGRQCMAKFGICRSAWYNAVKSGKIVARADYRIPMDVLLSPERNTPRSHVRWRLIGDGILEKSARTVASVNGSASPSRCICTTLMVSRLTTDSRTCI